jgi:DNA-binding MarR family transcriptional regulator
MNGIKDLKALFDQLGESIIDEAIKDLAQKGLIDVALDEESGQVMLSINDKGREEYERLEAKYGSEEEEKELESFLNTSEKYLDTTFDN